jgi:hypothetical protein
MVTLGGTFKACHAIKQDDGAFSALHGQCTVRLKMV